MMGDVEMLADGKAYDRAMSGLQRGEGELIPFEIVARRAAGENPVRIWRRHRGLTQEGLAKPPGFPAA